MIRGFGEVASDVEGGVVEGERVEEGRTLLRVVGVEEGGADEERRGVSSEEDDATSTEGD